LRGGIAATFRRCNTTTSSLFGFEFNTFEFKLFKFEFEFGLGFRFFFRISSIRTVEPSRPVRRRLSPSISQKALEVLGGERRRVVVVVVGGWWW